MTSSLYQPPLTPGFNSSVMAPLTGSNLATTRSPFFSIANQFLPRNLHDVIRWARYITTQSPVTTEVIRKLCTYPITEFLVDTEREATRKKYEEIFKSFRLKTTLHEIGFEYYTIGNVFLSIYFPIHRSLICPNCESAFNAKTAEFLSFENFNFNGTCPNCGSKATFIVKDSKSLDIDEINVIKWDPVNISVNHNPISNDYEYYYKIPNDIKKKIREGDRLFVNSIPWEFIEAVKSGQDFKFDKNNIFHLRNLSTGQLVGGVSIPPLISQYSLVFYQATLRQANESVAQDYMAPLRVLFPTAQTGNSDPVMSLSLANFQAKMEYAMIKHKQDNSHLVISPVPVGYQAISGEGKSLLVSQEIEQAEQSILLSMGVSQELLSGTTNWTSSTVGLRLLENTMLTYTSQIEGFIEWLMTKVSKYLGLETCKVTLTPFKLMDDDNLRQVLTGLNGSGKASTSTLLETYGLKYEDELKKIREDAVAEAVNKAKMEMEIDRGVFLAAKQMNDKFDQNNDFRTALTKAQQIAQELLGVTPDIQRRVLGTYRIEDYAMYLLVSKLLGEYQQGMAPQVGDPNDPNSQDQDTGSQGGADGGQPDNQGNTSGSDPGNPKSDNQKKSDMNRKSPPGPDTESPDQPKAGSLPKVK